MRRPPAGIVVIAFCLLPSSPGLADKICGPGLELGPGPRWTCITETVRPKLALPEPKGPVDALVMSLAARLKETDAKGDASIDLVGDGLSSRKSNRSGLMSFQKGAFMAAYLSFRLAAESAEDAGNLRERDINRRNMLIVKSIEAIQLALKNVERDGPAALREALMAADELDRALAKLDPPPEEDSPETAPVVPAVLPPAHPAAPRAPGPESDVSGTGGKAIGGLTRLRDSLVKGDAPDTAVPVAPRPDAVGSPGPRTVEIERESDISARKEGGSVGDRSPPEDVGTVGGDTGKLTRLRDALAGGDTGSGDPGSDLSVPVDAAPSGGFVESETVEPVDGGADDLPYFGDWMTESDLAETEPESGIDATGHDDAYDPDYWSGDLGPGPGVSVREEGPGSGEAVGGLTRLRDSLTGGGPDAEPGPAPESTVTDEAYDPDYWSGDLGPGLLGEEGDPSGIVVDMRPEGKEGDLSGLREKILDMAK